MGRFLKFAGVIAVLLGILWLVRKALIPKVDRNFYIPRVGSSFYFPRRRR